MTDLTNPVLERMKKGKKSKEEAEKAKIALSSSQQYEINLPFITADASGPKHLVIKLSRAKLEALVDDLVQRTLEPCKAALKDAPEDKEVGEGARKRNLRAESITDIASGQVDAAFVEAAQSIEELEEIPRRVNGPCLLNMVWRGRTPDISFAQAGTMGYRMIILPSLLLKSVMAVCDRVLAETMSSGRHAKLDTEMTPQQGFDRLGAKSWDAISERYGRK